MGKNEQGARSYCVQYLLALGQIGSKSEARDSGRAGALFQRIDRIVDFIQIGCPLGRMKSMNGGIELVGETQELRLDLQRRRKGDQDEGQKQERWERRRGGQNVVNG